MLLPKAFEKGKEREKVFRRKIKVAVVARDVFGLFRIAGAGDILITPTFERKELRKIMS